MPKKFCLYLDLKICPILFGIAIIPLSIIGIRFCVFTMSNTNEIAIKKCDHLDKEKVFLVHSQSRTTGSKSKLVSEFDKCVIRERITDVGYMLLIVSLGSYILFYIVMPCYILRIENLNSPKLERRSSQIVVFCMLLSGLSLFITIYPSDIVDLQPRLIALPFAIPNIYYCFCLHSLCKKILNERQRNEETLSLHVIDVLKE